MTAKVVDGFSTEEAAQVIGQPAQTVSYWTRSKLITPSVSTGAGRGKVRRWSFRDVVALRVLADLRKGGVSLQAIRKAVSYVQELGVEQPLGDLFLVAHDKDVLLVQGDQVMSALRRPGQLQMRIVFEVREVVAHVHAITETIVAQRRAA